MAAVSRLVMAWCIACLFLPVPPTPFAQGNTLLQSAARSALDQLRAEHQRVLDNLNANDTTGHPLDLGDPRVPEILKQGWRLAGAWSAAYFETHPTPSAAELDRIFEGFAPEPHSVKSQYGDFLEYHDYNFAGGAVRIGASTYVVRASYFMDSATGAFMVVARNRDGHFQTLFNIKDLAEKHYAQKDELGRWLYLASRAYYNGPLGINKVLPLSSSVDGHPRFLVDAYQSAEGGTTLAQLSIWEWDGAEAKPLLIELYHYAADFGGLRFDGKQLRIATKEDLATLFSCGMCPEPRALWTVRVTPTGVQDLGRRFRKPEFQWVDDLLTRIENGEDTTNLAETKVVEALKVHIRDVQAENKNFGLEPSRFSWGMMGECRILRRGQHGEFDLDLDEGRLRFSYVLRNGKHYFTHVRIN